MRLNAAGFRAKSRISLDAIVVLDADAV